jgi:hypothetical protein
MSFYATMSGTVSCHDKSAFTTLLSRLELGGWIVDDQFKQEDGDAVNWNGEKDVDHEHLQITIPLAVYRNLTRVDFFEHPTTTGWIWGSSTDGVELCWIDGPPNYKIPEIPLTLFGDPDDLPGAQEDDNWAARVDWLNDAQEHFHGQSYNAVQEIAEKYLGCITLTAENVDALLLHRQTTTLVRLMEATKDDVTKAHLEGLLNLMSKIRS